MTNLRITKRFKKSSINDQSHLTNKNLRKIRVICSDPEATDSSSDEDENNYNNNNTDRSLSKRRIVCEIVIGTKPGNDDVLTEQKNSRPENDDVTRKKLKLTGVRLRKWGKWASEIRDPISRKRIWLGTFNTAEEASEAYLAKKKEFQGMENRSGRIGSECGDGSGSPVHWKKRWRGSVYDPETERKPSPDHKPDTLDCDSDPEQEALKALQSMKYAFVSGSESGSLVKSPTIESSSGGEDSREEENKLPWLGLGIDMLVIDNHGKLVGQFSRLDDDLNIC